MKKKIFGLFAIVIIAVVAAFNVNLAMKDNGESALILANIEALAQNEGEETKTKCPNEDYVPDKYIETTGPTEAKYTADKEGSITIGDKKIGGYQKGETIIITVETFNCSGQQKGACCDQKSVGTFPV